MRHTAQIIQFGKYAHLAMSPKDDEKWSNEYIGAAIPMGYDAFMAVTGRDKDFLLFACDCACQTIPIWEDKRRNNRHLPRKALETMLLYLDGLATLDEVKAITAELKAVMGLMPERPPQWLSDETILCQQDYWGAAHCVWSVLIRVEIPWAAARHFEHQYKQRFMDFCIGRG